MKHLYTALLLASCSLILLTIQARSTDLLPQPQQITITKSGAPFHLNRNVNIIDPTQCTALSRFFTDKGCTIATGANSLS